MECSSKKVVKIISYVILITITSFHCTSVHVIKDNRSDYNEINEDLEGSKVKILKKNKEVIFGENVIVTSDSTFWLNSQRNQVFTLTSGIDEIVLESTWRGAKDGLYYGFIFGAGFGVMIALLIDPPMDREAFAPLIGIGTGMGGAVCGLMVGAAIGHTDRYMIEIPPDSISIDY